MCIQADITLCTYITRTFDSSDICTLRYRDAFNDARNRRLSLIHFDTLCKRMTITVTESITEDAANTLGVFPDDLDMLQKLGRTVDVNELCSNICLHIEAHAYIHTYTHTHIHTYSHTEMQTYSHTNTPTYTQTVGLMPPQHAHVLPPDDHAL